MKRIIPLIFLFATFISCTNKNVVEPTTNKEPELSRFNIENDLLLLHYDCKTDVDDLHSIAAFASLIRIPTNSKLNYHAVAGTYGIQEGEYVPGNSLFELAFDNHWSDAHSNYDKALDEVFAKVQTVLNKKGNVWIAEAGQSDFSSNLVSKIQDNMKQIDTKKKVNIVQHSNWNEEVTDQDHLAFAKTQTAYHKIPDGNALDNGTPGFNTSESVDWNNILNNEEIEKIWNLAIDLANTYNGEDGRYLNKSIKAGGLDFSDFCEVHHILEFGEIKNCVDYFEFLKHKVSP